MKTELTKLEQIKKLVGMTIDLAEMKLDDGVTVIEAEVFEAGQEVFVKAEDGQSIPLPVGEYGMEDGMVLVVSEEGIIGEIREPQAEEEAADQEQGVAAAEKPAAKPIAKKVVESVSKETYFSAEEKEALIARIDALEAKLSEQVKEEVVEMKEETAKPIVHNPENRTEVKITKLAANRKGETVADRVRNTLFN
jgi:hypothetical protein